MVSLRPAWVTQEELFSKLNPEEEYEPHRTYEECTLLVSVVWRWKYNTVVLQYKSLLSNFFFLSVNGTSFPLQLWKQWHI